MLFCFFRLQEINYDSPRGRVAMRTHANEWTTSYLLIHDADINDSGVYVCAPTSGGRTSIKVHVFLHGKYWCTARVCQIIHTRTHIYTKCFPYTTNIFSYKQTRILSLSQIIHSILIVFSHIFICICNFTGERPEAMQTGTSTYIANNIMQTILISIIISTYNIFQNYYTSILFSSRIPNEITWQTRAIIPKLFGRTITTTAAVAAVATTTTSLILHQHKPYEMFMHQRW